MDALTWVQMALVDVLREATAPGRPTGWSDRELKEWTRRMIYAMEDAKR